MNEMGIHVHQLLDGLDGMSWGKERVFPIKSPPRKDGLDEMPPFPIKTHPTHGVSGKAIARASARGLGIKRLDAAQLPVELRRPARGPG